MKKLFLLILLFISLYSYSQKYPEFILFGGTSFPLGKYGGNDLETGSFTQTGFNAGINIQWYLFNNWGIVAGMQQQYHPVDVVNLANAKIIADPFMETLGIRSEAYNMLNFSIGSIYKLEINKKIISSISVEIGGMIAKTPYQLHKAGYFMIGNSMYEITSSKDKNISFKSSIGFEYLIRENWSVIILSDYTIAQMNFGFNTTTTYRTEKRLINYLNLSTGIKIKL